MDEPTSEEPATNAPMSGWKKLQLTLVVGGLVGSAMYLSLYPVGPVVSLIEFQSESDGLYSPKVTFVVVFAALTILLMVTVAVFEWIVGKIQGPTSPSD